MLPSWMDPGRFGGVDCERKPLSIHPHRTEHRLAYIIAAQSLAYVLTAFCWIRVWRGCGTAALSQAALATALCFALGAFRFALALTLGAN